MLMILQNGLPVASLTQNDKEWLLKYLPEAKDELLPSLPLDREYRGDSLPRFVLSLLPKNERMTWMAKARHLMEGDLKSLSRQCLTLDNIGDITIAAGITPESSREELVMETPAPNALVCDSIDNLALRGLPEDFNAMLADKAAATGVGGAWPKAFLKAPDGEYIIKRYPSYAGYSGSDIAAAEYATLRAAASLGLCPENSAAQVGDCLAVKRFDRSDRGKKYGVCHLADLGAEWNIFHGSFEKMLADAKKINPAAAKSLFKQALFSWVTGDSDHHLENFALLNKRDGGGWEASPMYDALPSRFFSGDTDHIALTVRGKKKRLSLSDWEDLAMSAGVDAAEVAPFIQRAVQVANTEIAPVLPVKLRKQFLVYTRACELVGLGKPAVDAEKIASAEYAKGTLAPSLVPDSPTVITPPPTKNSMSMV